MMRKALCRSLSLLGLLVAAFPAAADDLPLPVSLNAFAVNMQGAVKTGTLQIQIDRWSTDEERAALIETLIESGPENLLKAVQKIKPRAGYIRTSRSLGWDIQYAREFDLPDGGRRIVFATDRPMNFWEVRNSARSTDYEFLLCEIRLKADGKGEGKLAGAAKISYKKETKTIEIENYGIEPVRLTQVTLDKPKQKKK